MSDSGSGGAPRREGVRHTVATLLARTDAMLREGRAPGATVWPTGFGRLDGVLGGGGTASLRNDPQAKGYSQILLQTPIPIPRALAEALSLSPPAMSRHLKVLGSYPRPSR